MSTQLSAPARPKISPVMPDPRCHAEEPPRQRRLWATGLTKTRAEAVLDWLEAHDHGNCQVSYVDGKGFTITE
jgi:hypothetical protein